MKLELFLIVFIISLSFISSIKPRNLKLKREEAKYKALCSVANKTVYQLFNRTIEFNDRYDVYIQQADVMIVKVIVDDNSVYPNYTDQTTFEIVNGKPIIPGLRFQKRHHLMHMEQKIFKKNLKYLEI